MIMTRSMKEFTLPQNGQLPRTMSLKKHRSMITAAQSPCNVDAGGCVSTLFHMFDWNPSGKKMSSSATKRLPSQRLEDEHYVRRERSLKEQSSSSESSSCKSREEDDNCSKRVVVPGVVARLMGLEFLPESTTAAENSSSQGLDHLELRQQQLPPPPPMTPVLLQELLRQEAGFKDSKKSSLKEKHPRGVPFSTRKQQQQPSFHDYLLQKHEAGEEEEMTPPWRKRKPRHMRSIIGAATEDAHFVDTRRIPKPAPPRRKPEQQQQPKRPFLSRLQAPPAAAGPAAALLPSKAQNQQLLSSPMRSPASSSLASPSKRMLFEAAAKILEPNMQPSSRRHLTASPSQTSQQQHQGASFGHQLARRRGGSHGLLLHSSKVSRTESMARSWNAQEDDPGEGRRMLRSQQQQPSCRPPPRRRPPPLVRNSTQPASNVSIGAAEPQTNSSKLHVEVVGIAAATKASLKTSFARKQSGSGNNQYSRSSKSETTAVASRSQSHQERIMDQMQQAAGSNEMLQAPDQALATSTEILQLADHNEIITTENCSNPNPSVAKLELTSQEIAARKEELHEVEVEVASCWQSTLGVQEEEKEDADFNVNIDDDDDDGWRRRSAQMVVEPNIGNERRKSDEPPSGGHGFRKMAMWAGRFRVQQQPGKQESKEIGLQGNRVFPLEKAVQGGSSQADLQQQQGGGGGGGGGGPHMTLVLAKSMARSLLRYSRLFGLPKVINNTKESEEAHKKGEDEDGLVLLNHRLTRNFLNMRPILKHQSAGYGDDDDDEEEAPPQPPGQKAASSHTTLVLTPLQEGGIQQCDDNGALNLTTDGSGGGREEQAAVQQQQQPEATNLGGGALDTMKSIDSLNVHGNLSPCNESLQPSPSSSSSSSCNRRRLEGREVGSPRMTTRSIDEVFPELPLEVMINMDVRTQDDQPDSAQITTDVTTMMTAEEEEEQLLGFKSSQRKHQQSFNDCQLRGEHCHVYRRRRRSSLSGSPNGRDVWVLSEGRRSPDVFVTEHHHLGTFPCSPLIDYETVFFPERKIPSNFQHLFAMMASSSSNSPFFNQELDGGCCTPQENQPNLKYCAQEEQQPGTSFHEGDSPVVFAMRLNSAECQLVGSRSGMDDCEQPSPVSVLESRFLDESPMTTPEASLAESEQQVEKRVVHVRTYGVDWGIQKQKLDKRQQQPHAPAVVQSETQSALERIESENIKQAILTICRSSHVDVSSLRLEEFQTTVQQESPQDEKDYVRTVLEASEFWELKDASSSWNTVVPQTQTSLPAAALDRCLFDRLEFENIELSKQTTSFQRESKLSGNDDIAHCCQHEQKTYSWQQHCNNRKLLFDSVNEALGLKFDYGYSSCEPWMNLRMSVRPRSFGPALVADVYSKVCKWRELATADDDLVDNLIDHDMSVAGGKWIDFSQEIVQVGLGIEQMLLKIMIEELVDDVCTISRF